MFVRSKYDETFSFVMQPENFNGIGMTK